MKKLLIIKRRFLTFGEKQLAASVFGIHLNMDNIQVIAHRLVLKHFAISPNGHIYFNQANWCEDFSRTPLVTQSWFIHELVHVWQYQQGIKLVRKALFDRKYRYVIEQGRQFFQYGIEQQAQMVQDYFIRLHSGQSCHELAQCIPFITESS